MKFMDKDFLLTNETAKKLYHNYAAKMPIIDYHCHINPREIAEDVSFENITKIWLGGDHYKWRMIRSNGIPEEEITGSAPDKVKFRRFAEALPKAIGNPMYHWTHLELKRYFGFENILNGDTAEKAWEVCNAKLREPSMTAKNIVRNSNVAMIGTTDDPVDTLEWHEKIKEDKDFKTLVLPSYRPDKAMNIEKDGFVEYMAKLSAVVGYPLDTIEAVKKALTERLEYFVAHGCKASDHGLDYACYAEAADEEINAILARALSGEKVCQNDADKYRTALLLHCGREYARLGVVMQIHYNTQRNTNAKMFERLGPDTGFDTIRTRDGAVEIAKLLSALDYTDRLPKTVLYSLNPHDNEALGTIIGAFQGTEVAGKIQHGSAWWFNDTKSGMEAQLKSLANLSLLGNFIGMLTDSRSFLSYTRHEYFRRILCNLIGTWVENGEYPDDEKQLGELVMDISYRNAARYFGIE